MFPKQDENQDRKIDTKTGFVNAGGKRSLHNLTQRGRPLEASRRITEPNLQFAQHVFATTLQTNRIEKQLGHFAVCGCHFDQFVDDLSCSHFAQSVHCSESRR